MPQIRRSQLMSWIYVCFALMMCTRAGIAQSQPATVSVDATEAARKIFHAHLVIPAKPGQMTLFYPKWIPGEHGPTGPIANLAGLKFAAGGKQIGWKRDSVEMNAFHIDVPPGAS